MTATTSSAKRDRPARVLIVDDVRVNRELLEVMLAPEGTSWKSATSGEEALAMVAQNPPDLILLRGGARRSSSSMTCPRSGSCCAAS